MTDADFNFIRVGMRVADGKRSGAVTEIEPVEKDVHPLRRLVTYRSDTGEEIQVAYHWFQLWGFDGFDLRRCYHFG